MSKEIRFTIGYNQDPQMLKLLAKYKDNISAFYFPIPNTMAGSGRIQSRHKEEYVKSIPSIISLCKKLNLKPTLLLNATCEGKLMGDEKHIKELTNYIHSLYELGLESICLTNMVYVPLIKEKCPKIEILASVNCYVKNVEEAQMLEEIGVDTIHIDRDINFDIAMIKSIKKATNLKLQILLNEGCIRNCVWRKQHFDLNAHGADDSQARFFLKNACANLVNNSVRVLKSPFIRPENVSFYERYIDSFKLSSRNFNTEEVNNLLKAYTSKKYEGNILDLFSSRNFIVPVEGNKSCSNPIKKQSVYLDNKKLEGHFEAKIKCDPRRKKYGCEDCKICEGYSLKSNMEDKTIKQLNKKTKKIKLKIKMAINQWNSQ